MTIKVKEVGYAYPTSITAHKLGFNDTGCWYLCFPGSNEPKLGFRTEEDAYDEAECYTSIPYGPWDWRLTQERLARAREDMEKPKTKEGE